MLEEKRVAIIGSREFKNKSYLDEKMSKLQEEYEITIIVSGGAKGADTMGVQWANRNKIATKVFLPNFKKHKRAYHYRNRQIVHDTDIIIALWNGSSTGTKYTIDYARSLNKEVIIYKYKNG
jgi:predicted Rossmann fold nucleotide-binding protein DprA/Smf involved in DNA uptake